jgi:hypothetical protein
MVRLSRGFLFFIPFLVLYACSFAASRVEDVSTEPAIREGTPTGPPLPTATVTAELPEEKGIQPSTPTSTARGHSHSRTEPATTEEQETAAPEFAHSHLEAGPHLRLASSPEPKAEDVRRAEKIVAEARQALEKYSDYRVALQEGYRILAPELPQEEYHFIHFGQALQNMAEFHPSRPTALLYERVRNGYEWIGVMYSAPESASEAVLDERFPLSMGQWHAHVNVCLPPDRMNWERVFSDPQFGLLGSIDTAGECASEGGTFLSDLFGWMLHAYFD